MDMVNPDHYFNQNKKPIILDITNEVEATAREYYSPALETCYDIRNIIKESVSWLNGVPVSKQEVLEYFELRYDYCYNESLIYIEDQLIASHLTARGDISSFMKLLLEKLVNRLFDEGFVSTEKHLGHFKVIDTNVPDPYAKRNRFVFIIMVF